MPSEPRGLNAAVRRLRRESKFVFSGSVERNASSSLSFVPAGPGTAVVRIQRIFHAPADLRDQVGQVVTVLFAESASARQVRPRGVFFTEPVAFGETIGVREIGSIEEPSDPEVFADLLARATVEMDEEEIREHLAAAAAVIHGTVVERHPVPGRVGVLSEHDPEWWVAVIHVEKSLKGGLKGDVRIRFPNSQDVRWYLTPKPLEGQEAIFVLHADGLGIGGTELAILHPNDMVAAHPDELDRHRRLI